MISPNYTILKPKVFVLTSIYAKVFEKRWRSQKGHVTSHQGQRIKNRRGTHGPRVPQIWCNSGVQTYPSPKWKMADPRNFGPIRAFVIELSC